VIAVDGAGVAVMRSKFREQLVAATERDTFECGPIDTDRIVDDAIARP